MVHLQKVLFFLVVFLVSCSSRKSGSDAGVETGVSHQLAIYRKSVLSNISYTLDFDIPASRSAAIRAEEVLHFDLKKNTLPLQIDFKEDPAKLKVLMVNGVSRPITFKYEHLIIPKEFLTKGENTVKISFEAGNGALNRNADYLYTLFVPDRARTVFPCFDQPDLKAVYLLSLRVPEDWLASANAVLMDKTQEPGQTIWRFKTSDKLSTYLFAFAAGKFKSVTGLTTGKKAEFLYRETDTVKIRHSLKDIFALHTSALKYYEDWTGIPYPFQQFGFVAIPDFQFGGMEHPGTIQYKASSLFLDGGATKDQLNARNNLIAHETAHMWFGDLVTMSWFSDVWMKEVFANFMADKSTGAAESREAYDLKFLVDHFPAAYAVDRTTGANPIRQPLDNLKDAGSLYGNIIYHKAPVMMQQLEQLMGKDKFQQGVREYLRSFANNNASWPDLIQILDRYTDADLQKWNKVWVNESGRPVISYDLTYKDEHISEFSVHQQPEYGTKRIWPQSFELSLFYEKEVKVLQVSLTGAVAELEAAKGLGRPKFILFNSSGQGYGRWAVDSALPAELFSLKSPLHRASAYISLYEQVLSGNVMQPAALLKLFSSGLLKEQEELNIKLLSGYISNLYWQFINPKDRLALAVELENTIWKAMLQQSGANIKKLLFKAEQDIFRSAAMRDKLYAVWKNQQAPPEVKLTEDDFTSLAFSLALRDDADKKILAVQRDRISNPDRKQRFEFIMPAVSSDQQVRDAFFKSLLKQSNRAKEANVLAALYYLHHPVRQSSSVAYLQQSLALLEEIQVTGDIFFPQSWLAATFGAYQSKEAGAVVRDFLEAHPGYNPKLRAKILQAADNVFRAEKICE